MTTRRAVLVVVGLLVLYAVMARVASLRTSATYDEPLHLVSAYVIKHAGDFRMNPEDPPLFQRWVGLALPGEALAPDYSASEWGDVRFNLAAHWAWVNRTLYPHPGGGGAKVDHERVLADARGMMLLVAIGLGAATAGLGWRLGGKAGGKAGGWAGGGLAGVIAVGMFALDPTMLGHGPLVKNDVALSLAFVGVAMGLVMLGKEIRWTGVVVLAVSAGVGVSTKFSGLLLGPFVVGILLLRAMLPWGWGVVVGGRGWELKQRGERVAAAVGISAVCLLVGVGMIWGVYGFRFSYSPDPAARVDLLPDVMMAKTHVARIARPEAAPVPAVVDATPTPIPVRMAEWINANRLLPETWAKGFIYTYGSTLLRSSFLMGEISELGWWYYFPAVLAFKWPLGTWVLVGAAAVVGVGAVGRFWKAGGETVGRDWERAWPWLATGMLGGMYLLVAMSGNMNLGIRHLLPMMPLVFALVGAGLAGVLMRGPKWMWVLVGVAFLGLAVESVASHNRYIAFFNLPARVYGPERLLTDSNLDWGQDLPALVEWQERNPGVTLSFSYFGIPTPESHGLRYKPLPGSPFSWEPATPNPAPGKGVVAISATWLQEVYMTPNTRGMFSLFRHLKPVEVINGTIFLYNWPPTKDDLAEEPMRLYWRTGKKVEEVPLKSALPRR